MFPLKLCANCHYYHLPQGADPCKTCQNGTTPNSYSLWVPKMEIKVVSNHFELGE